MQQLIATKLELKMRGVKKILVVDDDVQIREVLTELLSLHQMEITAVGDGHEAIKVLQQWLPDLILCDIMMPEMDGTAFHEIIMRDEILATIPFIFLTAKTEMNLARECSIKGADEFITKPFIAKELVALIKSKIDRFETIKNNVPSFSNFNQKHLIHEFNTPLNGIFGLSDVLLNTAQFLEPEDMKALSEGIKTSGQRLKRTLHNLLLYQDLSKNKLQFNTVATSDVQTTLKNTLKNLQSSYNQALNITYSVAQESVIIEKQHFEFVLYELIDNALKFSDGKNVQIKGIKTQEHQYELYITDEGIGMSPEEIEKIACGNQFNRALKEQQGLGLGLCLSKKMIENTYGVLTISSQLGKGTCISIKLSITHSST